VNQNYGFVQVSQASLVRLFIGLFLLTGAVIAALLSTDLELYFHGDRIALKVGATVVRMDQFYLLKSLAGPEAEKMSEPAFARNLTDLILMAELARTLRLDQTEAYRHKRRIFDQTVPPASDPQDLTRALFLIGELARSAGDQLEIPMASTTTPGNAGVPVPASPAEGDTKVVDTLHLKTILAENAGQAGVILEKVNQGVSFSELNRSFSRSPYAGTGGDIGWVKREDLPEGVFRKLVSVPVGSLSLGFEDEAGVHLFVVAAHPSVSRNLSGRTAEGQKNSRERAGRRREALARQDNSIRVWINPQLRETMDR
jgi:hypothetical protein